MVLPVTHSLRIDPSSGDILLHGFEQPVQAQLHADDFRSRFASLIEREWDHGNGYAWIGLNGSLRLQEMQASMSLCFFEGRLTQVMLSVALPDDEDEEGWPTEQTSLRHVSFLRRALGKQLGHDMASGRVELPWGTVWARFDIKGFMATAGVRYVVEPLAFERSQ